MTVSKPGDAQDGLATLALILLMICIWAMTHRYHGLTADAALYAVQAMAKLHPWLAGDIYLQHVSQDSFTVFSWFFAKLISAIGLNQAARSLFIVFTVWFLAAAWSLARRLSSAGTAWLAVVLLLALIGRYGSYGVFRYAEEFLTARSLAEALVVSGIACHYGGARAMAVALMLAALLVHPLMALPGLLLLICLWMGPRISIAGAFGGIALTALVAVIARHAALQQGLFALIDGIWLTVVRERSQFLFLQLWRASDWYWNTLPFASLALTLAVVPDQRVRQLAWAAMLVGAAGLAIALIASTIGPVAILLQGQAWRWVWITSFAAILLLAPTLVELWRNQQCGPTCAMLLIGGFTCPSLDPWACTGLTFALWLLRDHITARMAHLLRWLALLLVVVQIGWNIFIAWSIMRSTTPDIVHAVLGLQTTVLVVFVLAWWGISTRKSASGAALVCVLIAAAAIFALRGSLPLATSGAPSDTSSYADWRNAIPPGSNVAVVGVHSSVGFVWFVLDRADYLSIDQSSGVVFSRETALEVQRRSTVLEPVVQPSWQIMSYLARWAKDTRKEEKDLPLTAAALTHMCDDPQLNFVIAPEFVGFSPLRHTQAGPYKDWYLYDCRQVHIAGEPS